jgi:Fe-S cluster biosynthesis and repair protein YggX
MSINCDQLHKWANALPIHGFPFDDTKIALNGLYILFEKGECAHGGNRIVRVGTHTGPNQLRSRLRQHFLVENKDRSVFRKNIGRCILNRANDSYLEKWELDLTTKLAREKYSSLIDMERQRAIEREVSKYLQNSISFVILRIDDKDSRLELESKIISTVSLCEECRPSPNWLGIYSPKEKIRNSGLWLVNELYKQPLTERDFERLKEAVV